MTIMAFAFDSNNNDLFIERDGNLAIVFDYDCALQSIRQMLSLWIGEYVFNKFAGMPYGAILGSNPDISQAAAEKNIIKILDQSTSQVNKFCVNWNQYLLTKVNGNQLFADEDYAKFQTSVTNISYTKNQYGHNIMQVNFLFGSGATANVDININDTIQAKYKKTIKNYLKFVDYVPYQPTVQCTIQTPPNFIVTAGNIVVIYKQGGMYSNKQDVLGNNYYDNRVLTLDLEPYASLSDMLSCDKTHTDNVMLENYEIICPSNINVKVLTV